MCSSGFVCAGNKCTVNPQWFNSGTNVTNGTAVAVGTPILIWSQWNQTGGTLSKYVNSTKTNTSGSWSNASWIDFVAPANWTNFTFAYPSNAQNGNFSIKLFGNGTGDLQNVTASWFWYNVSIVSDTCTYTSGNWWVKGEDKCNVSTTSENINGDFYAYGLGSAGHFIFGFFNISQLFVFKNFTGMMVQQEGQGYLFIKRK
jgi:hypothetical protein